MIETSHTALVVWDVQNMLVNSIFNKDQFMKHITTIIDSARKSKVSIFYTAIQFLPPKYQSSVWQYMMAKRFGQRQSGPQGQREGEQQKQGFMPTPQDLELAVKPNPQDEVVITKHAASIFVGTHFEYMIRNAGIATIVFTGISTEMGVESSARDAFNRGFYPVIVSDAVSSHDKQAHERSLENMKNMAEVISTKDIVSMWT